MPIIAVALMLMSQRARLNGPVFVIGWLIGLAVIGQHNAVIMAVICMIIGAKLIGDTIGGFSG